MFCTDGDIRRHANNLYKKKDFRMYLVKIQLGFLILTTALSAIEKMNSLKITSLLGTRVIKSINKKIKNSYWYNTSTSLPKQRYQMKKKQRQIQLVLISIGLLIVCR